MILTITSGRSQWRHNPPENSKGTTPTSGTDIVLKNLNDANSCIWTIKMAARSIQKEGASSGQQAKSTSRQDGKLEKFEILVTLKRTTSPTGPSLEGAIYRN